MRVLRTYARVYTDRMDAVLTGLAEGTGAVAGARFTLPDGVEVATVGQIVVVAGPGEALDRYRATTATLIVDDLDDCLAGLRRQGALVVRGPQSVPTGRNLTARLPGGVQIEYVEWDQAQWERAGGRPC